jgi:hypothetical protein
MFMGLLKSLRLHKGTAACGKDMPQSCLKQDRRINEGRFSQKRRSDAIATNIMKTLPFSAAVFTAIALSTATGFAKKKDKDKDWDRDHHHDRDRVVYVERGGPPRDRTRTIYVIERERPVQRVVYVGGDGRYYRWVDGRRVYVRERYFDSYPSKYYYPDGRRRVTISLPF